MSRNINIWGVEWYSKNRLDGITNNLVHRKGLPVLFTTRQEARTWINHKFGYIKNREDLRDEPFGWRLPRVVKVQVNRLKEKPDVTS